MYLCGLPLPDCVCVSRITCSWTQKVSVLSFFHQVSPCDCLARPLYFPEYSKGEIRLKMSKTFFSPSKFTTSFVRVHLMCSTYSFVVFPIRILCDRNVFLLTFGFNYTARAAPSQTSVFFKDLIGVMNMIIAPPGPSQAGRNILHITSTCNLLRFLCSECKGQMGQFETAEICLESCIRLYQRTTLFLVTKKLILHLWFIPKA